MLLVSFTVFTKAVSIHKVSNTRAPVGRVLPSETLSALATTPTSIKFAITALG